MRKNHGRNAQRRKGEQKERRGLAYQGRRTERKKRRVMRGREKKRSVRQMNPGWIV
jgi:hypothetical protein